jgi:hypothetical protein
MEPALVSGVSSSWIGIACQNRFFIAWTLFAAALLVFQLGSRGDRLVVGAVWLAFIFLPVERFVHQLARVMARSALPRYVLLSSIALIWAWATCRFRGGDGPFHIHNLGIWRGYPFPFEEWGCFPCWREFHWFGLAGDLVIYPVSNENSVPVIGMCHLKRV